MASENERSSAASAAHNDRFAVGADALGGPSATWLHIVTRDVEGAVPYKTDAAFCIEAPPVSRPAQPGHAEQK